MQCWHLTLSSADRCVLFPDESLRRQAVQRVVRIAGAELVLYCVVDNHVHVVVCCDRRRAGKIKLAMFKSLGAISKAPVLPVHIRPVKDQGHLEWLVNYLLVQVVRHELGVHPALWSSSCFQDLIGARKIKALQLEQNVKVLLPRLHWPSIHEIVGLPLEEIRPASIKAVREAGIVRLVDAACTALCVGPGLDSRSTPAILAKRAVHRIARNVGYSNTEIAWGMNIPTSSLRNMVNKPVDKDVLSAVCVRLSLENAVARLALRQEENIRR